MNRDSNSITEITVSDIVKNTLYGIGYIHNFGKWQSVYFFITTDR